MPSNSTNAGTSLARAGSDYATLMLGVGNAVAGTQLQLTETSVNTTSALASTLVDVIAVQVKHYDDDGHLQSGTQSFTQKLPLIDFIDPVFYQWTNVRVQGNFMIHEIATNSTATSDAYRSMDHSSQHGLLVILGGGQTGRRSSDIRQQSSRTTDRASAVGIARLYAQLNPRTDVGVPKPNRVVQGPNLNVIQGAIAELPGDGTPATGRTMAVMIQLTNLSGKPISGKPISISTDGTLWKFTDPNKQVTDEKGNLSIELQRTFPPVSEGAAPPDTSPKPTVLSVRLGLVTNDTTLTF